MRRWIVFLVLVALTLSACSGSAPATEPETVATIDPAQIAKLEENVQCPFLKVETTFTENDGLHVLVANEVSVDIDTAKMYVLWYDEDGKPVDVGGSVAPNVTKEALTQVKALEKSLFVLPTEEGSAHAKLILTAAYFTDGTVWENAYAEQWLAYTLSTDK